MSSYETGATAHASGCAPHSLAMPAMAYMVLAGDSSRVTRRKISYAGADPCAGPCFVSWVLLTHAGSDNAVMQRTPKPSRVCQLQCPYPDTAWRDNCIRVVHVKRCHVANGKACSSRESQTAGNIQQANGRRLRC
jgi:hypothetical protein